MTSIVVHDQSSDYDDNECPTDPDIAGLGVVITYIFMAILTTVASVCAACLDEALSAKTAFFPKRLNARLSKNQDPAHLRRCMFWRKVLERLIIALADQQLITGFAILITGLIVYHDHIHGAHFTLIVYLSSVSSTSHLAAIITLRQYFYDNHALANLRIACIIVFAALLGDSMVVSETGPFSIVWYLISKTDRDIKISQGVPGLLSTFLVLWLLWSGVYHISRPADSNLFLKRLYNMIVLVPSRWIGRCVSRPLSFVPYRFSAKNHARLRKYAVYAWTKIRYLIFLTTGSLFLLQILFAGISVALVLAQKFSPGDPDSHVCSLNSTDENKMGYGQILAFLLLGLPLVAAIEAFSDQAKIFKDEAAPSPSPVSTPVTAPDELHPEDQDSTPPQRQDTEQRVGTPSHPPASSSTTSLAATFVSAVDQQPPQDQVSVQRHDTRQTIHIVPPSDSAVTSARQPEIEMNVLQRKNTA